MEGIYPLIIDGELMGKLTVTPKGPQTAFDVSCKMLPGILRVSVYGDGREGYLGVLAPEGDGLGLHKVLSRAALRDFPQNIESVEPAGLLDQRRTEAAQPAAEARPEAQVAPVPVMEQTAAPEPEPEPPPAPVRREQDKDLYWYASPDGALVCFDGTRNLLALPLGDPRIPAGAAGERRQVDGRNYLVFPTKNGRVQWGGT